MLDAVKAATERATRVHDYTDYIRAAACIMVTDGYGEAAKRAQAMGWGRVAEVLQKATKR